ncbi:MAG: adenylosuccinate synthase [Pseudomonadota bacterium]|nr:MAG: adenylosuccinate synthase [Pseudomonadota bacterium]
MARSRVTVVCGVNWGDEGKGRMVDYLAQDAQVVVRFQGGNNAGHTVVNQFGQFALHLVPSGIFHAGVLNVLGPGMVIDLEGLEDELRKLAARGVNTDKLVVSDRATVCFPFHKKLDEWEERRLAGRAYGSTKNGIAPAYGDRHLKKGVRIGDLLDPIARKDAVERAVEWASLLAQNVYGEVPFSVEGALAWCDQHLPAIAPRVCDTIAVLGAAAADGQHILLEAQLGALRDVYFGIYPYTTSSCALSAFAPVGAGLFGYRPDRVVGVMKAFATCVGEGPFVTRMADEEANALRESAQEYGARTGRPRTIGHFDAVASRYGARVQEATELTLTKLDSLSGRSELKICTHYSVDGRRTDVFPTTGLDRAEPVYETMPGWSEDVSECRSFARLPRAAQDYVNRIEELVGVRIRFISVGPERSQLIER